MARSGPITHPMSVPLSQPAAATGPGDLPAGRLLFWSVTSALAGFLFGFDTVVISGGEQAIQKLWDLGGALHGVLMGSALYGTALGSLVGGYLADRFGRKNVLLAVGVLFVASAVGCAFSWDVWSFTSFRLIGGLGIGISTVAAPMYISEIAPPAYRGRLAGMFQCNSVFGIVVAYGSNYLLHSIGDTAWRWMLGVAAVPSLVYSVMCVFIPESPRWLLTRKGDRAGGLEVLRLIQPSATPAELEATADEITAAARSHAEAGPFWSRRLRTPILLAFLVAFFNQLSGINAILYFSKRIFELAHLGESAALLQSVGIGLTNLVFTFVGLWLIDRLGRRTLLLIGSIGYIVSLGLTSWAFFSEQFAIVPYFLFAFIAAHAVGQGAVIWVLISEVFPNRHRATGQTLGAFTHWIFAALLTSFFPLMVNAMAPGSIFLFFCGMMGLQLLWVLTMVPETKGVPLEEMERRLSG
jgi:SP family arabinose:H+ symporter-like MFS transporter